jgi:hypothetical protein
LVFRYYSVFKASEPLASRRSRTGEKTSSGRQKTHSVSGPQASSQSIGNYPIAPPRLSNRFRSSKDDYSTSPGPVKGLAATLCAISIHFRADPSPSPLGGALTLSCVEPHDSHRPGRSQSASDVGERYCSAVLNSVKQFHENFLVSSACLNEPDVAALAYLENLAGEPFCR